MDSVLFLACAVGAGFVLLGLVVYSYVRPRPEHRPSVTALLGLLGFALIASPNWTRISIRSDGLELSLLREIEARQLRALEKIGSPLPAETPAGTSGPREPAPAERSPPLPGAPRRASDPGELAPEEAMLVGADAATLSPEQQQRLLEAFERGELDLRSLSNAELLALNGYVTERANGRRVR